MYLLLGDVNSTIRAPILELLRVRGHTARIIENPLLGPSRFTLRLDTLTSASWLTWEDGTHLSGNEIDGVLVCRPRQIPSDGWEQADLPYVEKENRAALLAWLWSLECPVINRYPAALWFEPDIPLLFWQVQLKQCGLSTFPSLISNVEEETDDFVAGLGAETVFAPLTVGVRYPLAGSFDRSQLGAIQSCVPLHLTQAPMTQQSACLVGARVVWDGTAPEDVEKIEFGFNRFSALVGLNFIEFGVAPTAEGTRVAAVHAFPRIEKLGPLARQEILTTLVELLTEAECPGGDQ